LAAKLLTSDQENTNAWHYAPLETMKESKNPWFVQQRASAERRQHFAILLQFAPGRFEKLTGVLRSDGFHGSGHLSFPGGP